MFAQLDWQLVPDSDGVQRTTFGIDPHNSSMRPSRLIGIVERHAAIAPIHGVGPHRHINDFRLCIMPQW